MYGLKKRSKDESGIIRGAGTGTSDDVKKNVPAGSYIMPADSTQQIGGDNLKNMGNPTPVNLSNGEFEMSPDQVHSVGVQALDAMKNQTHTEVNQPQLGYGVNKKPELFFANGGMVPSAYPSADDIRRAQQNRIGGPAMRDVTPVTRQLPATSTAPSASPTTPTPTQGGGFGARFNSLRQGINRAANTGLGKLGTVGALASTGFAVADTPTEQYRERFGLGDYNPDDSDGMQFAKDFGVRALGAASDLGNALTLGQAGRFYADKQRIASEAKAAQPAFNAKQDGGQSTNPFIDKPVTTPSQSIAQAQAAPQNQQQNNPYAIQQKGNSFSYANPSAAAQAREQGIPELQSTGIQTGRGIRGVNEFMANTREMGPTEQQIQNAIAQREMSIGLGMQGYGNNPVQAPQRNEAQEAERQAVIRAARAPIAGARGLTANQVRTLSDLQQGEDNRANQRYTTDANNVAGLQREAMGQAGQNYRTELGEQGTNNRFNSNLGFEAQKFNATNDLDNREFNLTATEKGFGIRNSARVEKLYEQYDKAETDEQRQSIQEKINRYSGNKAESSNPYISVKRGEISDEKGNTIQPAGEVLFNRTTGETIDPLAQMPQSTSLPNNMTRQVGTSNGKPVYEDAQGNRFIGN